MRLILVVIIYIILMDTENLNLLCLKQLENASNLEKFDKQFINFLKF